MPKEVVRIGDALKRLGDLLMDESTEALESKIRLQYANDPNFFCEDFLGVQLWEKQKEILESVRDNERTTVRSCNSAGKTFTAACAVLWFLKAFIPSTVVTTAPTARQVRDILWKEIASRYHLSKKQVGGKLLQQSLTMSNQKKWFATGFTTSKEDLEKFQGFHNDNILIIVDEACFDDKTEILTHRGWRFFKDLQKEDSVLTMNPKNRIGYYRRPKQILEFDYDGIMYELNQRGSSFCVTPNHKMFCSIHKDYLKNKWDLKEIHNLKTDFMMQRRFSWSGSNRKYFILPFVRTSRKRYSRRYIPIDLWVRFLGWYLSEGALDSRSHGIGLSQKNEDNKKEIIDILKDLGYESKVYGCDIRVVSSTQLYFVLKEYGDSALTKRIPNYVKQLPSNLIEEFLFTYLKGDGYCKDGEQIFYTSSKQMADDLQELILKTGNCVSLHERKATTTWIKNHWARGKKGYCVIKHNRNSMIKVRHKKIKLIQYKGKVYSVEIPPHYLIFVRRNGYCMWSGNSGVDRMIFEAIEGLMASGFARLLLIGNPTDETTVFGDSFKPVSGYSKMSISAFDTPNLTSKKLLFPQLVTLDWVDNRKTDWGEDSPLYQVHVLGQFPSLSEDTLISLSWIEAAIDKEVDISGDKVIGMDVARYGQDETVMVYRTGNKMESMQVWSGQDSMYSTGRLISVLEDTGAFANVDEIGLGAGVVDRAKEQNFSVRGINIGGRSSKPDKFFNLRSEVYWNLRELFQNGAISIKKDLLLMDELSKIKFEFTSRGQIKIESKEDIKKRLRRSPDRADAFALAFMNPVSTTSSMGDVLEIFSDKKYYNSNSDILKCPICLNDGITSLSDDLHMCLRCGVLFDNNKEVVGKKQLLSEVIAEDIARRKEYERSIDIKILPRQFA